MTSHHGANQPLIPRRRKLVALCVGLLVLVLGTWTSFGVAIEGNTGPVSAGLHAQEVSRNDIARNPTSEPLLTSDNAMRAPIDVRVAPSILIVVDDANAPIEGARVVSIPDGMRGINAAAAATCVSDDLGRVELPEALLALARTVTVSAVGFQAKETALPAPGEVHTVQLDRGLRQRLRLVDMTGRPVSGIDVQLSQIARPYVPWSDALATVADDWCPLADARWAMFRECTGLDGTAVFDGLHDGGYFISIQPGYVCLDRDLGEGLTISSGIETPEIVLSIGRVHGFAVHVRGDSLVTYSIGMRSPPGRKYGRVIGAVMANLVLYREQFPEAQVIFDVLSPHEAGRSVEIEALQATGEVITYDRELIPVVDLGMPELIEVPAATSAARVGTLSCSVTSADGPLPPKYATVYLERQERRDRTSAPRESEIRMLERFFFAKGGDDMSLLAGTYTATLGDQVLAQLTDPRTVVIDAGNSVELEWTLDAGLRLCSISVAKRSGELLLLEGATIVIEGACLKTAVHIRDYVRHPELMLPHGQYRASLRAPGVNSVSLEFEVTPGPGSPVAVPFQLTE